MVNYNLLLIVLHVLLFSSQTAFCGARIKRQSDVGVTEASSTPESNKTEKEENQNESNKGVNDVMASITGMSEKLNIKASGTAVIGTKTNADEDEVSLNEEEIAVNEISIESIEMLGEDSMEALTRCYKCNKPSYKFKKDLFCTRCSQAGLLVVNENMDQVNCKKCRKYKYRSKNWEYCESSCPEAMDKPLFPAQQDLVPEHMKNVKGMGVTSTSSPLSSSSITTTTSPATSTLTPASTTENIGVLAGILRYLVVANTFDNRMEVDLPQAIVEN